MNDILSVMKSEKLVTSGSEWSHTEKREIGNPLKQGVNLALMNDILSEIKSEKLVTLGSEWSHTEKREIGNPLKQGVNLALMNDILSEIKSEKLVTLGPDWTMPKREKSVTLKTRCKINAYERLFVCNEKGEIGNRKV